MRVCIWKTGHEIADMVAEYVARGCVNSENLVGYATPDHLHLVDAYDVHIAYGILRGASDVFRECDRLGKPWLHLDRGYFHPGHYDGYYRVSLRGTQQTGHWLEPDYDRLAALKVDVKPWRGFDESKPVLVCPMTPPVKEFFRDIDPYCFTSMPLPWLGKNWVMREKGDSSPINFDDYSHVVTFNSSVGWQAIAAGIPCISDPTHSIVGSYFANLTDSLPQNHQILSELQYGHRERLFGIMAASQLTLSEIRAGELWRIIQSLLSTSDSIPENPKPAILAPTASCAAPSLQSRFAT